MTKGIKKEVIKTTEIYSEDKPEIKKEVIKKEVIKKEVINKTEKTSFTTGEVFACGNLKLRERPATGEKSRILKLLEKGTIVDINLTDSTKTFYKVSVGESVYKVEGFCMKKYIKV